MGLYNGRMSVEQIFHFSRVNVLSSSDDHILDAAHDLTVAVLVEDADVPTNQIKSIVNKCVI